MITGLILASNTFNKEKPTHSLYLLFITEQKNWMMFGTQFLVFFYQIVDIYSNRFLLKCHDT